MITAITCEEIADKSGGRYAAILPRRDYFILPLLSLATILLLLGATEVAARILWPKQEMDDCLNYSSANPRFRPNCDSQGKITEGPWVTYHYNECGYRTSAHCGSKAPGTLRVVLLGSSITHGVYLPYDQIFATRMGDSVARDLRRPVEVENLAVPHSSPLECYRRIGEAIGLEPNVVVFALCPEDMKRRIDPEQLAHRNDPNVHFAHSAPPKKNAFQDIHTLLLQNSTTSVVAQHYLFQDTGFCLRVSLAAGDGVGYLQTPFAPSWEARFSDSKTLIGEMAAQLRARRIPLLVVAIPSRIEAALLNSKRGQAQLDPFAFGNRIREIAEDAGATYVDLMRPFSHLPRPEDLYFPVNLHPTGEGHEAIARELTPAVERVLISSRAGRREEFK
jgi:hypothetical protein